MNKNPDTSSLFLLRVWTEDSEDGKRQWRGKVQHVISGEARPFLSWPALEVTVLEMLAMLQAEVEPGIEEGGQQP
jgi:hypothetical protein